MHRSRLAIAMAGAVAGLSLTLDFLSSDLIGDVVGWDAAIWPAVALLAASGALALIGDRREGLPPPGTILLVALTALATVLVVAKVVDAAAAANEVRAATGDASIGLGNWVLLAAALVALIGAVATSSRSVA